MWEPSWLDSNVMSVEMSSIPGYKWPMRPSLPVRSAPRAVAAASHR